MVVAEPMGKPTVKVSVSDSESSIDETDDVESSENEDQLNENADENSDLGAINNNGSDNENGVFDDEVEKSGTSGSEADENMASDHESSVSDDESLHLEAKNDSSSGSEADNSASDDENDVLMTNEGWADSVSKILSSSKPKNKKTLVLSRAKKHSEIVKQEKVEKPSFEVIGETDEKPEFKPVVKQDILLEPPAKRVKHIKPSIRTKPNILEKDRERLLSKIATKGVVQLFNAVRNQQKTLEKDLDRKDLSEGKKEKILKKFDKRTFLDTLMGNSKSVIVDEATTRKNEVKDEEKPKWSALRDDFMMGAKMKDWDKESVDE